MKQLFLLTVLAATLSAVEIELKDGTIIIGDLLCEEKGKITVKEGTETVSIFKKSMKRYDSVSVAGTRKFTMGEEYLLSNKNELTFINSSRDSLTIRLRNRVDSERVGEKTLAQGEQFTFMVPDGTYYETVRYWRPEGEYYLTGAPYIIETKCSSFDKVDVELKGYAGDSFPQLKGPKREYER